MTNGTVRVLLIEDNPADSRLIQEYLAETRGVQFEIACVPRLSAGLEHLARTGGDVVLLDLSLPDSQGLDTFSVLREQRPRVPIVVLTGLADDAVAVEAVQRGAQDYLVKGEVSSALLVRAVRYAIERHRAEEVLRQRNRELTLLNRIIAASVVDGEPLQLLQAACRELAIAFGMPRVTARMVDEKHARIRVVAEHADAGLPAILGWEEPLEGNPALQQLLCDLSPQAVYADGNGGGSLDDACATDPMLGLMRQSNTRSLLRVPLVADGAAVGWLDSTARRRIGFRPKKLIWCGVWAIRWGALARARLVRDQGRLIAAVGQIGEAIILVSLDGGIQYVNAAFERITGYDLATVRGCPLDLLNRSGAASEGLVEMRAAILRGEVWHGRLDPQRKDATTFAADVTCGPVRDEHGVIVSYVIVERDVTHELQVEERYRQAQRMEAVGRLTGGIAHDFNNLLTAINGFAELAQMQVAPHEPAREMIDRVLASGRRAARLVSQLLAFSRKQVMQLQVIDLNARVTEMDSMLRHVISEDISMVTALAPGLWPIEADPAQVEQVVVNLVVNARDAMPSGGKLTIETANVTLDEAYAANHLETVPGDYALLAISDTGTGMTEEVKSHLFEPYFTTKGVGKGSGLGLSTVLGIVKQHGGHIACYSEEGIGTTFKVYLPRTHAAVPDTRGTAEPVVPCGGETVLVVEDSQEVRTMVRQVLDVQGYCVLEAADAEEGLQVAATHPGVIHLLVADVVLPGASGRELADQLTAVRPGLRVLFMSGYTENAIVHHGVLEEGMAFLHKPFSVVALAAKVRRVLDGKGGNKMDKDGSTG